MRTSKTGVQLYNDASPYKVSEDSLARKMFTSTPPSSHPLSDFLTLKIW